MYALGIDMGMIKQSDAGKSNDDANKYKKFENVAKSVVQNVKSSYMIKGRPNQSISKLLHKKCNLHPKSLTTSSRSSITVIVPTIRETK